VGKLAWVPAFFALRIASALVLLKLSASMLTVGGFTVLSQLMLFTAVLNVLALFGMQNGVVRQAAAAADDEALGRVQSAAFAIWLVAVPLVLAPVLLGREFISKILVGSPSEWPAVVAITVTVLVGAPSGICCALLTGRKRVAQSLSAQGAGLIFGAAGAAWRIMAHDPAGAAIAFAGGSLATACVAAPFALQLGLPLVPRRWSWAPVRTLLRYSAAIAATTGYASIVMFGLRWLYREHYGVTHLGYWLAASRISDMSTQLLGLFMIQVFVPHLAMTVDEDRRRAFLIRCWFLAAGMATGILVVFSAAPTLLIHLLLSNAYLPAASIIQIYMVGDVLRVWASLAMHTSFANGRPFLYAGIEMAALSVMAAVAAALIVVGDPAAPQTAYVAAYAVVAIIVSVVFLLRREGAIGVGVTSSGGNPA
jgi:O-antigen/teichoic acid export membrane protein